MQNSNPVHTAQTKGNKTQQTSWQLNLVSPNTRWLNMFSWRQV